MPSETPAVSAHNATLVIGGGIAGIQASLEIAESGHKVYLVERTGTIGGRMAMFDKTFPTLDCAACILTPKMVAVGQSPNIELLMLSEVQEVTGSAGAFKVKILKHATRVDASACVACGDCAQFCPVTTASEFDMGIATRKGIFIPFPQAVPNTYMIDPAQCLWVQSGGKKCGACVKKCTKGAVHLDAQDEVVELEVSNIIVATGYDTLDARRIDRYGYGVYPNVLNSLEFERLTKCFRTNRWQDRHEDERGSTKRPRPRNGSSNQTAPSQKPWLSFIAWARATRTTTHIVHGSAACIHSSLPTW